MVATRAYTGFINTFGGIIPNTISRIIPPPTAVTTPSTLTPKILEPKLTTLCQDTAAIGRIAAEKLIDLIENPKTTLIDRFSVDGTLFKGASVKKIRGLKKQDPASNKL